jgi:hypothetical protein
MTDDPITIDSTLDPFTQCYLLQRELALSNALISELCTRKNVVLFGETSQEAMEALKGEINEGDLPELRIVPKGGTPKVGRDSTFTSFLQKFDWQLATGELSATELLFPLTLALLCAWSAWQPKFAELTWQGLRFVHLAQAVSAEQGVAIENENRGIRGWATVWSVQVDVWLPTSALQQLNTEQ